MKTLETNLEAILNEKKTKILPGNIRKGVTIFGVEGAITSSGIDTSYVITSYEEPTGENRKLFWYRKSRNCIPFTFSVGGFYHTNVPNRAYNYIEFKVKQGESYTFSTDLDTSIYKYAIAISDIPFPIKTPDTSLLSYHTGWVTSSNITIEVPADGYIIVGITKLDDSDIYADWNIDEDSEVMKLNSLYKYQLEQGNEVNSYQKYIEPKLYILNDNDEYIEFE